MRISELPIEIQDRVVELQARHGNAPNIDMFLSTGTDRNFDWNNSPEGWSFWHKVDAGVYSEFYARYPIVKKLPAESKEILSSFIDDLKNIKVP